MELRLKPKRIGPPSTIKKEAIKVWEGWNNLGNREVVREAGIKGTHIKEVIKFLALRQDVNEEDALHWFKKEVSLFVDELLDRKQIFRACHILQNVKEDSSKELAKKMYTTCDAGLREYIGSHLQKFGSLDEKVANLWNFLHIMTKHSSALNAKFTLEKISLEILDNQKAEWKWELASILFLKSYDERLFPFLKSEMLWIQLLKYDETEILKVWINIRYSNNTYVEPSNIHTILKRFIFKNPISSTMIDAVMIHSHSRFTQDTVLDELSRFGVYCTVEKSNVVKILKRLHNVNCLGNLFSIINSDTSVISLDSFMDMLIHLCLDKKLFGLINSTLELVSISDAVKQKYIYNKHFDLICNFRDMFANINALSLQTNIFKVSNYLSHGNVVDYLMNNSEIALALFLFSNNLPFLDVITQKTEFKINDIALNDVYAVAVEKYPLLNLAYHKLTNSIKEQNFILYDILKSGNVMNVDEVFQFRFNKDTKIPQFNDAVLVNKYGYTKDINYIVYMKHIRPTVAAALFTKYGQKKHGYYLEIDKVTEKASKYALSNLHAEDKCISAVSFLEMLGINTEGLRIAINVAKLFSDNYGKFDFDIPSDDCLQKLLTMSTKDLDDIRDCMEKILINKINFHDLSHSGAELINSVRLYNLVMKFCKINNLKLPECFPKMLAKKNLWFHFLLFVQVNDYPIDQVIELVHFFKNPNIIEHVEHAIRHDIPMHGHSSLMRRRDSRSSYLSRVGVRREPVKNQGVSQASTSKNFGDFPPRSRTTSASTTGSSEFEALVLRPRATLLQILILCHGSSDPPRAFLQASQFYQYPLLAIFATCYEPDSVVTCWLTWLAVSCDLCKSLTNYDTLSLSPVSVSKLLCTCLENGYPKTLMDGFNIFLPDNPLKIFMELINLLIEFSLDPTELSSKLAEYSDVLNKMKGISVVTDIDIELTYLTNKIWIQQTSLQLLGSALNSNFTSIYDVILVLEAICKLDWTDIFHNSKAPNFSNIVSILNYLYEGICVSKRFSRYRSALRIDFCKLFNEDTHRKEVTDCINTLLDKQLFETALKIAELEYISVDLVITRKWEYKCKITSKRDASFWKSCDDALTKFKVTPNCVVDFYQDQLEVTKDPLESYRVQKLACKWARQFELPNQYDLEMMLWLSYINLDDELKATEKFEPHLKMFSYKKLSEDIIKVPLYDVGMSEHQRSQVDHVIKDLLDEGNFWQALKLEKMFDCKNIDLEILKLCSCLAEGIIKPHQLSAEEKSLLTTKTFLGKAVKKVWTFLGAKTTPGIHHFDMTSESLKPSDMSLQETLGLLQTLMEKLSSGVKLGENIFMVYRISVNTEIPYYSIIACDDSLKMLKAALGKNCVNKIEVVSDFITVYEWSKEQIADFICEAIVNAASMHITSGFYSLTLWDLDIDRNFSYILHLLQDSCSVLGYQIFSYTSAIYAASVASDVVFKLDDLILMTELLIRAHDCFSVECNMDGITLVLRKCHKIVGHLLDLRSWKLMVRLLTGIGRYSEMKYIFHLLKDHDQFEYLLRRNLSKDTAFKFALLEFLTRYCPNNHELLKMVALHFALYSEVAQLWENEAETVISNLISIAKMEMQNNKLDPNKERFVTFTNNDGTEQLLKKAIGNYEHATEFYMQGEKYKNATRSAQQAQLLALQISLLKALPDNEGTVCLLKLDEEQIEQVIKFHLGFFESKILTEAYAYEPHWGIILYEQFIMGSNDDYLRVFLNTLSLTDPIVDDVLMKFLHTSPDDVDLVTRMKLLVDNIPSVHTKYRVASQLGFKDIVEELLEGDQLFYLKDTVWKRGYQCQNP